MSKKPYETPKITDLSPAQIFNSSDTAISRDGLKAQRPPNNDRLKDNDRLALKPGVQIVRTIQQIFPDPETSRKIDRLRPIVAEDDQQNSFSLN